MPTELLEPSFSFIIVDETLFTIKSDGSIERGPAFTTNDEMALEFWKAVESCKR